MTSALISFSKNLGVFFVSLSVGIIGYAIFAPSTPLSLGGGQQSLFSESSLGNGLIAFFDQNEASSSGDDSFSFDDKPMFVANLNDPVDMGRDAFGVSYFLERDGQIIRVGLNADGNREVNCFAKLQSKASLSSSGFSALVFHPEYLVKKSAGYGLFYVVAAEKAGSGDSDFEPAFGENLTEHHQDVLYEYRTANPFSPAFLGKRREILRFSQPGPKNNLSSLAFDRRGFLYLGVGDGAELNSKKSDISKNASSLLSAYGKVLRIDPLGKNSTNRQYGIPSSNPFRLIPDALPELWAYGLRAPHSLSVDPFNEWLFISETGRAGTSELNVSRRGAEHFGWDLLGGTSGIFTKLMAGAEDVLTAPQIEFASDNSKAGHSDSCAGGFVYSGERFPSLVGKAIFGDQQGRIMAASVGANGRSVNGQSSVELLAGVDFLPNKNVNALRQGPRGEIFILCKDGDVFEIGKGATASIPRKSRRPLICSLTFF